MSKFKSDKGYANGYSNGYSNTPKKTQQNLVLELKARNNQAYEESNGSETSDDDS